MKKVVLLAFMFLFLLFSGGIQVLVHTCGGETTVKMMPASAEDPCGCGDGPSDGQCCTVDLRTFHLDEMQQPVVVHVSVVETVALAVLFPFRSAALSDGCIQEAAVTPSPPFSVSPTILNCTFLV